MLELRQKPGTQLALELGVARNRLYKWQAQLKANGGVFRAPGRPKVDVQINLIAVQNTASLSSKNKSSSSSMGASIGTTSGLAVTASASRGKGKTNGNDVTWTETQVEAGNKVTLESGTDTNLIGAQVRGNQVVANVGTSGEGNLNIQSLQDTSTYDSKQKSTGISVSIPIGAAMAGGSFSSSSSKINSDYASVNEQSGIFAGDEGFQVSVAGNTNLTGAVIASTEQAIQNDRNSLTTKTLTVADIQNKAEYEAKGMAATVGGGLQAGLPQFSGAGYGEDGDKAGSTTRSAVSQGTVSVTDNDAQQDLTGTSSVTAVAMLNRDVHVNEQGEAVDSSGNSTAATIAPIFDADKVAKEIQAQVQITEAFSQEAGLVVNSYAEKQMDALRARYALETDPEKQKALQAEVDRLRLETHVLNVLIGEVTGLGGAALTHESLAHAAEEMRKITIENSKLAAPIVDDPGNGEPPFILSNVSGVSVGGKWDLVPIKTGGTRTDLDGICGTDNKRCKTNEDGSLALNDNGQVQWNSDGAAGQSLKDWLTTPEGKKLAGITGAIQGTKGTLFGVPYEAGSWQDHLIEAFGGPHDFIGGQATGLYDEQGSITRGMSTSEKAVHDRLSEAALLPSLPFAAATLLPAEVWQAISVFLGAAK